MKVRSLSVALTLALTLVVPTFAQDELGDLLGLSEDEQHLLTLIPTRYQVGDRVVEPVNPDFVGHEMLLELGTFQAVHRVPGFDVHTDTPSFDNAAAMQGGGKKGGAGSCMGMSELVIRAFENPDFPGDGTTAVRFTYAGFEVDTTATSLFALTQEHGAELQELVHSETNSLGQRFDNGWVNGSSFDGATVFRRIVEQIDAGRLPLIVTRGGNLGFHALVAYRVIEFSGKSLVYYYDPNAVHTSDDAAAQFVLVFDPATGDLDFSPWMMQRYGDSEFTVRD